MDPRFPEPRMRDEFRRELRTKLLIEAQTALAPRARRGTAWTFLRPLAAIAVAFFVLVGGAGTAAAGSVPGDTTFGLKRAFEDLQVNLTLDDVQRVQLLAQLADRRLEDLQKVADREDRAPTASEEYAAAVVRFRAAVTALQQAAPQDKRDKAQDVADAARDKHESIVDELQQRVPEKAKDALERARDEEHRDTPNEKRGPNRTERPGRSETPEPSRSPRPSATPRTSDSSRSTQRPETTRTATPRPTGSERPSSTDGEND
jgi:hypothetical protein